MSNTTVLDRFLDPVASILTPEVARRLVEFRADAATQSRLDELAANSNEGLLTPEERAEHESFVSAIDFVTLLQIRARQTLVSSSETPRTQT